MYCKSCGAENLEVAKFCKSCGDRIDIYGKVELAKSNSKLIFGIIAIAVVVVIIVLAWSSKKTQNNSDTATITDLSRNTQSQSDEAVNQTTSDKSCDSSQWFCNESAVCSDTLGDGKHIIVAKTDAPKHYSWQDPSLSGSCAQPQCSVSSNGEKNLVADNSVDFSKFPARNYCKSIGGRLPTVEELQCIYDISNDFGVFNTDIGDSYYWSSAEGSALDFAMGKNRGYITMYDAYVRCVRSL